ncbi:hypothetical protein [Novosphingobium decolorationis]|uniref:hypothetical protein n=1 Tax=Novosphingobium decolorationis TaxID=2698673 RepID=UPI0030CC25CA
MLPEKDLIVLRSGIPPVYGKKIRYYQEKDMLALTKVQAPAMPTIRPDPSVPARSLRVITAAEASGEEYAGSRQSCTRPLDTKLVHELRVTPDDEQAEKLFQKLFIVMKEAV